MQVPYTNCMTLRKYRWSKHYESAEEELVEILASKKINAERWSLEGYDEVKAHKHGYDTRFWCAEGSIVFNIDGKEISLQTGDTLDIPADTVFDSRAGFSGVVCYEAKV